MIITYVTVWENVLKHSPFHWKEGKRLQKLTENYMKAIKKSAYVTQPFQKTICLTFNNDSFLAKFEPDTVEFVERWVLLGGPLWVVGCAWVAPVCGFELNYALLSQLHYVNLIHKLMWHDLSVIPFRCFCCRPYFLEISLVIHTFQAKLLVVELLQVVVDDEFEGATYIVSHLALIPLAFLFSPVRNSIGSLEKWPTRIEPDINCSVIEARIPGPM